MLRESGRGSASRQGTPDELIFFGPARPVVTSRGLVSRQDELKGRAAVGRALAVDPASMKLDEGFHQREPQADAPLAELVISRRVMKCVEPGEERLEQVRLLAARYA